MSRINPIVVTLIFLSALCGISRPTSAANFTYTGLAATCPFTDCSTFVPGDPENWGDARNWSPQGVPGASDIATIGAFSVKVGTRTVQRLSLTSGNLLSGNLTIAGPAASFNSFWTAGSINCTVNIASGSQLTMSTSASKVFGGVINNSGIFTWKDGAVFSGAAATFNNKTGGVFNAQADTSWFHNFGELPVFNNNAGGVVNSAPGAGKTSFFITVMFNNAGTVNANSGTLDINGGGTSAGTWTAANGGRVNASGTLTGTFNPAAGGVVGIQGVAGSASSLLGGGLKVLGAGRATIYTGTVTFNGVVTTGQTGGPGTLELEGGTVLGTSASNLLSAGTGFYNWTTASIGDTGSILNIGAGGLFRIGGGAIIGSKVFSTGIINNSGTTIWQNGAVFAGNAATFNNKTGGVFNAQANTSWFHSSGTALPVFNNNAGGVVNGAAGAGNTSFFITVMFNNAGTVNANSGTLDINGGGTSAGTWTAANGARVNTSGTLTGTINAAAGGVVGIQGVAGSASSLLGGGLKVLGAGRATIYQGTVTFNGAVTTGATGAPGTLELEGGTVLGTSASNLLSAGTGFYNWTTARIGDTGSILNIGAGGLFLIGGGANTGSKVLGAGIINNSGTTTWQNGALFCGDAATFNNKTGGVFNAQANTSWFHNFGEVPIFNNNAGGVVNGAAGAGNTSFFSTVIFNNAGTVNGVSGTLDINGGGTSAGTWTAANASRVNTSGTLTGTINPATGGVVGIQGISAGAASSFLGGGLKVLGAGRATIYTGTVTFNGAVTTGATGAPGTLELEGGTVLGTSASNLLSAGTGFFNWTTAQIGGTGSVINIGAGGQFLIGGGANTGSKVLGAGIINNNGTTTWQNGALFCGDAATFNNKTGGVFNAQANTSWFHNFGEVPIFNNNAGGVVNGAAGAGNTSFFLTVTFNNAGTVNGVSGTLDINGGGTSAGTWTAANASRVNTSGTLTGTINPATGGVVGIQGISAGAASSFLGGGLKVLGAGRATIYTGTVTFNGAVTTGQTGGPGTLELEGGTVLGTSASNLLSAGTGFFNWTTARIGDTGSILNIGAGGQLRITSTGSKVFGSGAINNSGVATWKDGAVFSGDGATFNNKSGGVFNAQANNSWFHNFGEVPVFNNQAGATLNKQVDATTSQFSAVTFNNAGTINLNKGVLHTSAGLTQTTGTTTLVGGSLNAGTGLTLQGGTLTGTGTVTGIIFNTGGTVAPGLSPGTITNAGDYVQAAGGKLAMELNSTTPGTGFDQLVVNGTVALNGSLNLTAGFAPAAGNTFLIINNDGTDAVTGTFTGLPQGALVSAGGALMRVSYVGGDGNDVVLTAVDLRLSINDVSVNEGNTGTSNATLTVTLSEAINQTLTVPFSTEDALAVAPGDYTAKTGTVTFTAGQTTRTIVIAVVGDLLDENLEKFRVNLGVPSLGRVIDGLGQVSIVDNDNPPTISVSDAVAVTEGNTGTVNATFNVTLSTASGKTITANFATADGTATVAGNDYVSQTGALTFAPGETTKTVTVQVKGDLRDEADETFNVTLNTVVNATVADGTGVGTILDDDGPSVILDNAPTVTEGTTGTKINAVFTIRLSAASPQNVTVSFATADFTAQAGLDYIAKTGTVTFLPGETSKIVNIQVTGDVEVEGTETFLFLLTGSTNSNIADGTGAVFIIDDEPAALSLFEDEPSE